MKAVLIDLSKEKKVKILHINVKSVTRVINSYKINNSEDIIKETADLLRANSLAALPAYIVPPEQLAEKELLSLPNMPDRELLKVIPRELAKDRDLDPALIIDFIRNRKGGAGMKDEVLAIFISKKNINTFLDKVSEEGIKPYRIIPSVQAKVNIFDYIRKDLDNTREGFMFIEAFPDKISINLFKNSGWGFERDFVLNLHSTENGHTLSEDDSERINIELNRTIQYFKQKFRGTFFNKFMVTGESSLVENVKNLIRNSTGMTVVSSDLYISDKTVSIPDNLSSHSDFINDFSVALGISLSLGREDFLNVLPDEYSEKRLLPKRLYGIAISLAALLSVFAFGIFYIEGIKSSLEHDLKQGKESRAKLASDSGEIRSVKAMRGEFFLKRRVFDLRYKESYKTGDFMRRLTLIAPESISFIEMIVNYKGANLLFTIKGSVNDSDVNRANRTFVKFYERFRAFDDLVNISQYKVSDKSLGRSRQPVPKSDVNLFFTIKGEMDAEK